MRSLWVVTMFELDMGTNILGANGSRDASLGILPCKMEAYAV
jgi:hypothetical protein